MQKLAMMLQFTKQKVQYNCLMYTKVRKKICGDVSTLNHVLIKSKMKLFSEFITKIIITTIIMIQFCSNIFEVLKIFWLQNISWKHLSIKLICTILDALILKIPTK